MSAVPLGQQIACVARELALRRNVYPKWVETGRMTAEKAADEIAAMQAALETLVALRAIVEPRPAADAAEQGRA